MVIVTKYNIGDKVYAMHHNAPQEFTVDGIEPFIGNKYAYDNGVFKYTTSPNQGTNSCVIYYLSEGYSNKGSKKVYENEVYPSLDELVKALKEQSETV